MSPSKYHTWVDGQPLACVPLTDRGLNYGDGVFRTLLLWQGQVVWLERQLEQLCVDARKLALAPPPLSELRSDLELASKGRQNGVIKVLLTAGDSQRGYARAGSSVRRIVQLVTLPETPQSLWSSGVRVESLTLQLASQPAFGGAKHLNRLEQVLARRALSAGHQEGLLCDADGDLASGIMSNLFWFQDGCWHTHPLDGVGVAGLTRQLLLEAAAQQGIEIQMTRRAEAEIQLHCEQLFLCNSLIGIWPVARWGDRQFDLSNVTRSGLAEWRRALQHPRANGGDNQL